MIRSMEEFTSAFRAARCVSTPVVAIRTADPASTTQFIIETLKQNRELPPLLGWDLVRGLYAISRNSGDELARVLGERQAATIGPVDALFLAQQLWEDGLLLYSNAHRFWNDPGVMQGIWDLRDSSKATGRMLVLLAAPGATLPQELGQDVLILDEPLPSTTHLEQIVRETFNAASLSEPEHPAILKAVDALIGLAAFPAEQALAISLVKRQLNTEDLWERKRQIIEQTPGLSVWRGGETFEDIGGVQNVKDFLLAVLRGIEPPRVIVFIDEIEKAFAGTGTDLSGVKTEMTGTILTYMQDREVCGEYLNKGKLIYLEGRLQTRKWAGPEGEKRTTIEVVANQMQILDPVPKDGNAAKAAEPAKPAEPVDESDNPFNEPGSEARDQVPF
ncbi:MAG: single-stranded DNA-binding protein [Terriglobia bacterium]